MAHKEVSAEARKSALDSDYSALYAVAGLTDALAEALKSALADTQQKASKRITELQDKRPELSRQARTSAGELRTFVITLPEQFKNLPETTKARIAELQRQANELVAHATSTFGDFAGRGKEAVDEARNSARNRSGKAGERVTPPTSANATDVGTGPEQ
jgi:chromosome segregation ATPase